MSSIKEIYADPQIRKFSYYGFLKNLKFFEPYLVLFLLGQGLSLFQIGLLYTIREITINILEVPSGILGDKFGYKNELLLCFLFYIVSFIIFFFTTHFFIAAIAMTFFGLGEAFRSGTHKAMIFTYLEIKGWENRKTLVYGKTRSASLLGSALSSIFFIGIIMVVPTNNYIFLASILPYLLNFILITTYPNELNTVDKKASIKDHLKELKSHLIHKKEMQKVLLENGLFESSIESTKDLLQPLLEATIVTSGMVILTQVNTDQTIKIVLGFTYAIIYIFSSYASKNAYRIKQHYANGNTLNAFLNRFNLFLGILLLFIAISTQWPIIIILFFLLIYALNNTRKPLYIDVLGDLMAKDERATILSISSQLKSLLTMIIAPLIGYAADKLGINDALAILGLFLILIWTIGKIKSYK
ncbi:MAG: MFS transporter [Massilibacteroides sp.]|nr:MFS transporter [Massilibacteroides sp.]